MSDDLAGAYALNAVDAAERRAYEEHLSRSESARNEATELADTAVVLGLAVAPEAPSDGLRASILAQIETMPQDAPAHETPAETKARARWFARPVTVIAGMAAAIALILGGGVLVTTLTHDPVGTIQAASDVQRLTADVSSGGTGTVVYSTDLGTSAFLADGMAALPADRVYELWYIDSNGARPAGTFTVGSDGSAKHVLEGTMNPGDTVGVTVEPLGGSTSPTTDPVFAVATA